MNKIAVALTFAVLIAISFRDARAEWDLGQDCAHEKDSPVTLAKSTSGGAQIESATSLIPAGAASDFVLHEPYKQGTPFFAAIERDKFNMLGRSAVSAASMPENHALVKSGLAQKNDTLIIVSIPSSESGFWRRANLYVYKCVTPNATDVSRLQTHISSTFYSAGMVWLVLIAIYTLAALSARLTSSDNYHWFKYFDPVVLTAGTDGRGSLAKLQVLFFSLIVFGLVAYIVLRTGVLSDLSPTILLLLGIAGVGSAAAKASDAQRTKLDFENWSWLIRKNWLPQGGLAATNDAKWRDIFSTDGEFDVYRFQSFVFCLAVGAALLAAGVTQLASFQIPETFLGILGLSQVVYIGGKLVTPTSVGELNKATTDLRALERKFTDAAWIGAGLEASVAKPTGAPADLADSKRRAGEKLYTEYMNKAQDVALLVKAVTGDPVDAKNLEPAFV
jgi:hypothetical protein